MTDKLREAAQQALEALVQIHPANMTPMAEEAWNKAIVMLGDALVEQPAEPVAWQGVYDPTDLYWRKPPQTDVRPLYTAPQPAIPPGYKLVDDERVAALCDLSYAAGMKAGWNFCVNNDDAGFERSQSVTGEAMRVLKKHRTMIDAAPEAPQPAKQPLTLWTEAQHERAYRNSPVLHKDVKSLAAFKRVAKEIAAMYGITGETK